MKRTKTILRYLIGGALAGIVLFLLFPGLTIVKAMLCIFSISVLIDLVKADIRDDIRADAERAHIDTRVWLRDWFDPEHSHLGNANDAEGKGQ